jgi:hypothetical protein
LGTHESLQQQKNKNDSVKIVKDLFIQLLPLVDIVGEEGEEEEEGEKGEKEE